MRPPATTRRTKQRDTILKELCRASSHPSADELYNLVRRKLPRISLGTVYRNLELLAAEGLIQKLEISGTQKRFDGNVSVHYHIRCLGCGRVADVQIKRLLPLEKIAKEVTSFDIVGHRLEFLGLCSRCRRHSPESRSESATIEKQHIRGRGKRETGVY
jgi:Fur family ferric uptake transcriptional regulator